MHTKLTIDSTKFLINNQLIYSELKSCNPAYHGLMMNARFIQGVFDDKQDVARFHRYGRTFDPDANTDALIASLQSWYDHGLRAITVGFQGGGPCFTIDNLTIQNNPYTADGTAIDPAYLDRMARIINAADKIGMVVIVSLFYGAQSRFFADDQAVLQAVKTASHWLCDQQFTNVLIEIANEHDIPDFAPYPILATPDGIVTLIQTAKEIAGMPVGCSGTGGYFNEAIAHASDVILIHGNGQTRQQFYNLIQKAKAITPARPIVCNEDSQAVSRLQVAFDEQVSWGYYNNMTKQEPPTDWTITLGEDAYFAHRMATALGLDLPAPAEQVYLQGFEPEATYDGKRWIRLANLYPERIDRVTYYRNGVQVATAYDEPFSIHFIENWLQGAVTDWAVDDEWQAVVQFTDGSSVTKTAIIH